MRYSFRLRLMLAFSLSLSILLVVFGLTCFWGLKQLLEHNLDNGLTVVAKSEADFASHSKNLHLHDISNVFSGKTETGSLQRLTQITDLKGKRLFANYELGVHPLLLDTQALTDNAQGKSVFLNITSDSQSFRVLYMPFQKDNVIYSIQVATPMDSVNDTLSYMLNVYLSLGGLTVLLSLLLGFWMAQRAILPIQTITQSAQHISLNNLEQRIPDYGNGEDELSQLVSVLNKMLQRLDYSVNVLRHFTSNVSHELRTPLTDIEQGQFPINSE